MNRTTASATIKLRDHPLLTNRKVPSWPPLWVSLDPSGPNLRGEVGILKEVKRWDLREMKCFLYIEHGNSRYLGYLLMEDPTFCQQLYELLMSCCGRSIKEIGDMDVSHLL